MVRHQPEKDLVWLRTQPNGLYQAGLLCGTGRSQQTIYFELFLDTAVEDDRQEANTGP